MGSAASCMMGHPCEGKGSGLAKVARPWDPGAFSAQPAVSREEQQVQVMLFLGK